MCQDTVLHLECPLDQLLDVYDIWMGVAEDKMCSPSNVASTVCKVTEASDLNKVVDVGMLCQNKTLCELSFASGQAVQLANGYAISTCNLLVLSVTYSCVSKYCIETNKSFRPLAVLAVSTNTDKAIYVTISNTLYQH